MRLLSSGILGIAALTLVIGTAKADYVENFTNGIDFTVNDPFWLDNTRSNGFITTTTTTPAIFPGFPGSFDFEIPSGVGGSGNFLFDGTYFYDGPSNPDIPVGHDEFFISSSFAVVPNTVYDVTFYATDANGINNPSIQPEIDGTLLGSPVSPLGDWATNGWQQFTFTWNSGSNTSASLILHDYQTNVVGNDFGVANISVTPTPEPGYSVLLVGLGLALITLSYGKRARRTTT
jgi:hypothetical protein